MSEACFLGLVSIKSKPNQPLLNIKDGCHLKKKKKPRCAISLPHSSTVVYERGDIMESFGVVVRFLNVTVTLYLNSGAPPGERVENEEAIEIQ